MTISMRRILPTALTLTLAASLAACGSSSQSDGATASANSSDTLKVATSFYPIEYLAQEIGGDHVQATSVTPTNVEPHDYELSPKDISSLSEQQLVLYVSGFQSSLDDALAQVSGPTQIDLAKDVDLVHHDGLVEEDEAEDSADATQTDDSSSLDPHFWLDPQRMQSAAEAIEAALASADPDNAKDYEANLTTLTATLGDLDSKYSTGLGQCERTTFVTSHSAFGYLADRYHLTQASVSGIDPEAEPSPAEIAAIKQIVEESGTTTIFTEELVSPEIAQALADETGTTTAVLNPIESEPEDGDYAQAMRTNLDELRSALNCQ